MTTDELLFRDVQYAAIFNWMETHKVSTITVRFNGEGDSGSFENDAELNTVSPYDQENYTKIRESFETTRINTMKSKAGKPNSLQQLVLDLAEKIEDEANHDVDWYNNDGGSGSVEWILDGTGEDGNHYHKGICLTVSARVIEYEHSYFSIAGVVEDTAEPEA